MSEQDRARWERQQEDFIKVRNLEGRMRAADPKQRDRIDRATGRTFADGAARGMYDDDSRIQRFRDDMRRARADRTAHRHQQARVQGARGRN